MTPVVLRAEALFCSTLQPSEQCSPERIRCAVWASENRHSDVEMAGVLAQEYGDHPDAAVERMGWCLTAVRDAFHLTPA